MTRNPTSSFDNKDRLGEKLHEAEQARENQWAAERDHELLQNMRRQAEEAATEQRKLQPQATRLYRRILCPIDLFAERSADAVAFASRITEQNGAELYLLNVCSTLMTPPGSSSKEVCAIEDSARCRLDEFAKKHLHGVRYTVMVTTGDFAERILAVQEGLEAELIVMGTHGRQGMPRFFLGSVAEQVIRAAHCPVLTVPPRVDVQV